MKICALLFSAIVVGALPAAAAESQQEFGYASAIEFAPGDALYVVPLSENVYRHVTRSDLADVRVFNGAGEIVPYSIRRVASTTAEAKSLSALPLFPLSTQSKSNDGVMDVEVRNDGTVVRVRKGNQTSAQSGDAKGAAYLVDASRLDLDLRALNVALDPKATNIVTRVTIEASDDLKRWEPWVTDAPLVQTEFNGQRLEQLKIDFPVKRAKYLRITSADDVLKDVMRAVTPLGAASIVEPARTPLTLKGVPDKEPGVFRFELGAQLPVDKINLRLTENNAVARFELEGRADEKSSWQRIAGGVAFRLSQNGQILSSSAFPAYADGARSYRVKTNPVSSTAPELELQWAPHELVFAARGNPPFTLAYGKSGASSAALAIESLVPGYGTANAFRPKPATLGNETSLSGASALKTPPAYGRYGLWAVLVLGAAVLGYMGMRLAKEAGAK